MGWVGRVGEGDSRVRFPLVPWGSDWEVCSCDVAWLGSWGVAVLGGCGGVLWSDCARDLGSRVWLLIVGDSRLLVVDTGELVWSSWKLVGCEGTFVGDIGSVGCGRIGSCGVSGSCGSWL